MRNIEIALRLNHKLKEKYESYHLEINPWLNKEEKEELDDQIFLHIIQAGDDQSDEVMINIMDMTVNGFIKQVMKNKNPFIKSCTRNAEDIFDIDQITSFYNKDIISKSDFKAYMIQQEDQYEKEGKIHIHHNDEIHDITFYRKYIPEIVAEYLADVKRRAQGKTEKAEVKTAEKTSPQTDYDNKELEKKLFHPQTKPTKTITFTKKEKAPQPKPKPEVLEPIEEYIKKVNTDSVIETIKKMVIALYKRKITEKEKLIVTREKDMYCINWRKVYPWVWKAFKAHGIQRIDSPYTILQEMEEKGIMEEQSDIIIQKLNEGNDGIIHMKVETVEKA